VKTDQIFKNCEPVAKELFESLIERIRSSGPVTIEVKETSLCVLNRAAFLGIHPKKSLLEINIVSEKPLKSSKVFKAEQISKSRYHNRLRLAKQKDIDKALMQMIHKGYELLK
jgi:hypothetical protein